MNFTENLEKIEQLLKKMESQEGTLEEALADFEKGVSLIKECNEYLANAKQKVTELSADITDGDEL